MTWRRIVGGLVTLVVAIAVFKARVDRPAPRLPNDGSQPTVKVGDERTLGTTTPPPRPTTAPAPTPVLSAGSGPTTPDPAVKTAEEEAPGPSRGHRTVVDVDGFRLYLTVGGDGRTTFARDERFDLTLRVVNVADTTRQYDTNEQRNFELVDPATQQVVWDDVRCNKAAQAKDRPITGPLDLAPGASVSFADAYPRRDCAPLAPGRYDVVGLFTWHPSGADGPTATIRSLPVEIALSS